MSIEIRVPPLGESIVDATIASWLKKEGDTVQQGEALVELETDKVNLEVTAEQSGVLQKVIKQVGDTVAVDDVLGLIGEQVTSDSAAADEQPAQEQQADLVQTPLPAQSAQAPASDSSAPGMQQAPTPASVISAAEMQRPPSPLARRIAADNDVDISQVAGTSPHGRITKEDVLSYIEERKTGTLPPVAPAAAPQPVTQPVQPAQPIRLQPTQQPATNGANAASALPQPVSAGPAGNGREERIRMSRRRQTIAQRLVEAQHTAAMLTTFNEVDMSAILDIRARRKESFKERHQVSLGFMSFFTKAVVGALKAFPRLNAEIQGNEMVIKHYYDIGIAVSTDEGLVVPVLRDADRKSFADIERDIADLAKRAREGALSLPELQGGTFTITNGGVFGSLLSTPILNAPQVGILGMHKIEQRPIALDGQVVIRPMMYVALSYDHRIVDGSEAVSFLVRVKELVEDPERLMLEG